MRAHKDEARFMQIAISEAVKALEEGEVPVGACIVLDGEVVSSSHNAMEGEKDPTAHAEIRAIRAAAAKLGRWRLAGCTLYVTLEPCAMCAGSIVQARMDKVVYAASDPKAGACGSVLDVTRDFRLNHFVEVASGPMKEESGRLLAAFFEGRRQVAAHGIDS